MKSPPEAGESRSDDTAPAPVLATGATVTIPVLEERLTVDKRIVETGHAVRLRKSVVGHSVQVDLPLERQSVAVRRVTLDRPVDVVPVIRYEGDVMIVPVVEERLVWRKQLVLVEELHVERQSHTVRRPEDVFLQREQIAVERFDPAAGAWVPDETASDPATGAPGPERAR